MKTYIYTYERKRSDVNGNPKHYVTIYRIKKNMPILFAADIDVGYRSKIQAVHQEIKETVGTYRIIGV